jgi:hypothetical protein
MGINQGYNNALNCPLDDVIFLVFGLGTCKLCCCGLKGRNEYISQLVLVLTATMFSVDEYSGMVLIVTNNSQ